MKGYYALLKGNIIISYNQMDASEIMVGFRSEINRGSFLVESQNWIILIFKI